MALWKAWRPPTRTLTLLCRGIPRRRVLIRAPAPTEKSSALSFLPPRWCVSVPLSFFPRPQRKSHTQQLVSTAHALAHPLPQYYAQSPTTPCRVQVGALCYVAPSDSSNTLGTGTTGVPAAVVDVDGTQPSPSSVTDGNLLGNSGVAGSTFAKRASDVLQTVNEIHPTEVDMEEDEVRDEIQAGLGSSPAGMREWMHPLSTLNTLSRVLIC